MNPLMLNRRRVFTGAAALAASTALVSQRVLAQTCPPPSPPPPAPPPGPAATETLGLTVGTGVTATASSVIGGKGVAAVIGTTSFNYEAFTLYLAPGTTNVRHQVDIIANIGGVDQLLVSNIIVDHDTQTRWYEGQVYCPLSLPSGTTLKFAVASSVANATLAGMITGMASTATGALQDQSSMVAANDFIASSPFVDPICQIPSVGMTLSLPYSINPNSNASLPQLAALFIELSSCGIQQALGGGYVEIGVGPNAANVSWLFPVETEDAGRRIEGPYPCVIAEGSQLWARAWSDKNSSATWGVGALGVLA